MKAAFIVAPRKFEIRDIPMPKITPDEMLVKIEACGVCSSDMPGYVDSQSEEMKKRNPFPRRAGHEPAGAVVEATRMRVGLARSRCCKERETVVSSSTQERT